MFRKRFAIMAVVGVLSVSSGTIAAARGAKQTLDVEGLAMHTAKRVYPGLPIRDYVAMADDEKWYPRCLARQDKILASITPDLDKSGPETALKYTYGKGNTGMQREVYCAAWIVTGRLLRSGMSYADLARIPENKMIATVRRGMTMK